MSAPPPRPTVEPYGTWLSPISAADRAAGTIPLREVQRTGRWTYWIEGRPREAGRQVLVRQADGGEPETVTPDGMNVRTRVHEYGGGAYIASGEIVIFSSFADGRLYRQEGLNAPIPLTPPGAVRFADLRLSPDGRHLFAVRERHAENREAENDVVVLDAHLGGEARSVARGHDFFASPRPSPDGRQLAWLCWDHPRMPWDGTELWLAELDEDGSPRSQRRLTGGSDDAIFQPAWAPDGSLVFASDRTGFWNLYRWDGENAAPLAPMDADCGMPLWVFDASAFTFLPDGAIAMVVTESGLQRLHLLERGQTRPRPLDLPFTSFGSLSTIGGDPSIACIATSPTTFSSVALVDPREQDVAVLRAASDFAVDPTYVSVPEPVDFPTSNGERAHALFYPPRNPEFEAPPGDLPPLLVLSHGGPTGMAAAGLGLEMQFWTTRGFAVVDVNYRGSSGFGRAYRERLKGRWGIADVDDCVNAALYLARSGRVDGERMAIRGGSAGGFTTLAALTFRDAFAAGASYYGVADLEALATDTHKFESRYLDGLVAPYPSGRAVYQERSPVAHTDRLARPLIIFQGLEDAVVPPNQAEKMVAALRAKDLPFAYLTFPGEQHGFRQAETLQRCLEAEWYFYCRVFGLPAPADVPPVAIENLD